MSLQTYNDLLTAIPNWLARVGDTQIANNAADFVTLAEQMIAYGYEDQEFPVRPLRCRGMETPAQIVITNPLTGNTVGGAANTITLTPQSAITSYTNGLLYQFVALFNNTGSTTLNVSGVGAKTITKGASRSLLAANDIILGGTYNFYYDGLNSVWTLLPELSHAPLPANYLAMRSFYRIASPDNQPIDYMAPSLMNSIFLSSEVGPPKRFTLEGDAMRFAPVPDTTYFAPMIFYQKFPTLSTALTNWLMTNAPDVYLSAACFQACVFRADDEGMARWYRRYQAASNALQTQDTVDRHSGSAITIQNDTGNP